MSGFRKSFKHVEDFDGDSVEFTLTGLTRKDVILLTPIFTKVSEDISEEEAQAVADTFMQVIKPHITSMKGLKDDEGNNIGIETMISEQYFFSLSSSLVNVLMEKSNPVAKKEVEKKLPESLHITSTQENLEKTV